jgi:hypothetical protein
VTTRRPSGLNDANSTGCRGGPRGWPVAASQSRAVPSKEAVSTRRPSGLNDAELTPPAWLLMPNPSKR